MIIQDPSWYTGGGIHLSLLPQYIRTGQNHCEHTTTEVNIHLATPSEAVLNNNLQALGLLLQN